MRLRPGVPILPSAWYASTRLGWPNTSASTAIFWSNSRGVLDGFVLPSVMEAELHSAEEESNRNVSCAIVTRIRAHLVGISRSPPAPGNVPPAPDTVSKFQGQVVRRDYYRQAEVAP